MIYERSRGTVALERCIEPYEIVIKQKKSVGSATTSCSMCHITLSSNSDQPIGKVTPEKSDKQETLSTKLIIDASPSIPLSSYEILHETTAQPPPSLSLLIHRHVRLSFQIPHGFQIHYLEFNLRLEDLK